MFMGLGWCWAAAPIGPEGRGEGKSVNLGKGVAEWLEGVSRRAGKAGERAAWRQGKRDTSVKGEFSGTYAENPQVILLAALPR